MQNGRDTIGGLDIFMRECTRVPDETIQQNDGKCAA